MSLEYYTTSGHILPIGLAVCGFCREKHLKNVDLTNSTPIPSADSMMSYPTDSSNLYSNIMIKRDISSHSPSGSVLGVPNSPSGSIMGVNNMRPSRSSTQSSCSSVSSTNGEVQILVTPVIKNTPAGTNV